MTEQTVDRKMASARVSYQEIDSGIGYIYLTGRLDVRTVPLIEAEFVALTAGQKKSVIVDLSGVELMNSAGLGMLISTANAMMRHGRHMALLYPKPRVERVIRIACLDMLLPIMHDLADAWIRLKTGSEARSSMARSSDFSR
jgi:anti-anti-sigma factor